MRTRRAALTRSYGLGFEPMSPKCVSFLTPGQSIFTLSKGRLSCYTVHHIGQK